MSKMSAVKTFLINLSRTDPAKASVAKFVCLFFFWLITGNLSSGEEVNSYDLSYVLTFFLFFFFFFFNF